MAGRHLLSFVALLVCLAGSCSAFLPPLASPSLSQGRGLAPASVGGAAAHHARGVMAAREAKAGGLRMAVEEVEYVKVFGRLGEKLLFGDSSAGACCHSGCDNCEWRYSFDILQSARPKWIPTYREMRFEDGREHITKWSGIFGEEGEAITKEAFAEKLAGLKFDMPLGPSGFMTAKQAELSDEAVEAVFTKLSRGKDKVTDRQFGMRLKKMVPPGMDDTGLMWSDFVCAMQEEADEEEEEELEQIVV
eukprot:CAMPEP_0174917328 /NCGR_PEP_ID=MMETSP1355-20121228/2382_1 /TAXON_ID=464990 /ORGANISM="Hemiselmis tepida, Strain CCMP443" /LENGTH=247 /DNA_ID=CAMNT_0016162403 /DNA_START=6 /DNA_END=749 /DNA_ORIENTATION=+